MTRVQSCPGPTWPVSSHKSFQSVCAHSLPTLHCCVTWCCVTASCWMTRTLTPWPHKLGLDACHIWCWVPRCSLNQLSAHCSPKRKDCCSLSAHAQCSATSSGPSLLVALTSALHSLITRVSTLALFGIKSRAWKTHQNLHESLVIY